MWPTSWYRECTRISRKDGDSNPGFASLPQHLKEESHIMKWQENMATKILVILHMITCFAIPYSLLFLCALCFLKSRYKEAESDYNKYLELNPRTATVEKELSQLLQAQNSLQSAYGQFDSGDFSKVLEYINKIVLVFSPGCLKV